MSRPFATAVTTTPLTSPEKLIEELPISASAARFVEQQRETIRRIIHHAEPRLLLVLGPCSVHHTEATLEYADRLKELQTRVADRLFVVMRVHGEKPRTTSGWKGMLYDPSLSGSPDIEQGLRKVRKLMLDLTDKGIPIGTELLDPYTAHYLGDLISWGQIGARTSASQIHRQLASGLPLPVGFKNTTQGDLKPAVNGILAAGTGQTFFGLTREGQIAQMTTPGNQACHLVLRGSENGGNFHPDSVHRATSLLLQAELLPSLLIDCSHDNCRKDHTLQPSVFNHVIDQHMNGNRAVTGAILESYLEPGRQPHHEEIGHLHPNISVTDPCIDWTTTERLVSDAFERLSRCAVSCS